MQATNAGPSSVRAARKRPRALTSSRWLAGCGWTWTPTPASISPPPPASPGRDRITVRVVRRVAELGGDQVLELLGEHVLEHLGLVVNAIPGHAERLGEIELEQAVVAQDLEGDLGARRGQLHAPVGDVRHQAE